MGINLTTTTLAVIVLLSACQSSSMTNGITRLGIEASVAESKAKDFFSALHHGDKQRLHILYQGVNQLDELASSDTAVLQSVNEKNGILTIHMHNMYRNEKGIRTEKEVQLFFRPDPSGQLILYDSKGLVNFEKKEEYSFGVKTGCINVNRDTTDQQLAKALSKARVLLPEKAFDIYKELKQGIQVTDWTWEPGDNGSAFGEGIVHNASLYTLPELKYKITYHNNEGDTLATDKGNVSYEAVQPGDNPSFTFYTSYVGKPAKAVIELIFDDDLVFTFLSKKSWTGKEWQEYASMQTARR